MKDQKLDVTYFNSYNEGYYPYLENDLKKILAPILATLSKTDSLQLLEIGCASGQFTQHINAYLNNKNCHYYGVDIAKAPLEYFPFYGIVCDAHLLAFRPKSFDLISYPAALHHLEPINSALNAANDVLKDTGFLYFLEPNLFHPHRCFFMKINWLYKMIKRIDEIPINPYTLKNDLVKRGFSIITFEFINLDFKAPSLLQKIQNYISRTKLAKRFPFFFNPWFIILARKNV